MLFYPVNTQKMLFMRLPNNHGVDSRVAVPLRSPFTKLYAAHHSVGLTAADTLATTKLTYVNQS